MKGVKDGDDDGLGQKIEVSHWSCMAYVIGVVNEREYMVPDVHRSPSFLHSLIPVFLSSMLDCIAPASFFK